MADKYVFDTNSFVEAYRKFYAFDIAPGYWRRFERVFAQDNIIMLDVVSDEIIKAKKDNLAEWLKQQNKGVVHRQSYIAEYARIMNYIQSCGHYNDRATAKWSQAGHADPWIVAAGIHEAGTVVTFEKSQTYNGSRMGKICIGEIADHFEVRYINLYDFMREQGIVIQ
ncbi:MAG: DUF4411 family protein [Lachnospiraceae bacterium]|nr:DUF4411 family protein [Lachnospiraceae bacterium]